MGGHCPNCGNTICCCEAVAAAMKTVEYFRISYLRYLWTCSKCETEQEVNVDHLETGDKFTIECGSCKNKETIRIDISVEK